MLKNMPGNLYGLFGVTDEQDVSKTSIIGVCESEHHLLVLVASFTKEVNPRLAKRPLKKQWTFS